MHSDPIADMLTRIRNGGRARHQRVLVPFSRVKGEIAELLKREGFIGEFRTLSATGRKVGGELEIKLKYDERGKHVISGLVRVSKPGLRRYFRSESIPKIRNGLGIMIVSTSQGLKTDAEARELGIGGEALCTAW